MWREGGADPTQCVGRSGGLSQGETWFLLPEGWGARPHTRIYTRARTYTHMKPPLQSASFSSPPPHIPSLRLQVFLLVGWASDRPPLLRLWLEASSLADLAAGPGQPGASEQHCVWICFQFPTWNWRSGGPALSLWGLLAEIPIAAWHLGCLVLSTLAEGLGLGWGAAFMSLGGELAHTPRDWGTCVLFKDRSVLAGPPWMLRTAGHGVFIKTLIFQKT